MWRECRTRAGRSPWAFLRLIPLYILGGSTLVIGQAPQEPTALPALEIDEVCSLKDDRFRVQVVKSRACCPALIELRIQELDTGTVDVATVETRLERLYTHRIFADSQFVVVGHRPPGGYGILMADLESRTVTEAWTSNHQFSPQQDALAYVPSRELEAVRSGSTLWIHRLGAAESAAGAELRPGLRVYPVGAVEPSSQIVSPLLWSRSGDELAFIEWSAPHLSLVRLELADGSARRAGAEDDPAPRTRVHRSPLALEWTVTGRPPIVELLRRAGEWGVEVRLAGDSRSLTVAMPGLE